MSKFSRLSSGDNHALERRLLESAKRDAPPVGAKEKTLAFLGLAPGVPGFEPLPGDAATSGAAGANGQLSAGTSAGSTAGITGGAIAKLLGAFGVAGILAAGILVLGEGGTARKPAVASGPATRTFVAEPIRVREATGTAERANEEPVIESRRESTTEVRSASKRVTAAKRKRPEPDVPAPSGSQPVDEPEPRVPSVLDEVALLDAARAALRTGDSAEALRILSAFERRFPRGRLVPEAKVLRVNGLLKAGRREEAEREGKLFLATEPRSPHAGRVRSLLGLR